MVPIPEDQGAVCGDREDGCMENGHRTWRMSGPRERNAAMGTIYKLRIALKSVFQ